MFGNEYVILLPSVIDVTFPNPIQHKPIIEDLEFQRNKNRRLEGIHVFFYRFSSSTTTYLLFLPLLQRLRKPKEKNKASELSFTRTLENTVNNFKSGVGGMT